MMPGDDEISSALPAAPQPSPVRRRAAIEQALRRFDAHEPGAAAPPRPAAWTNAPWLLAGRRYAGVAATAALVALVGVPAWNALSPPPGSQEAILEAVPAERERAGPAATETADASATPPARPNGNTSAASIPTDAPQLRAETESVTSESAEPARQAQPAPAPRADGFAQSSVPPLSAPEAIDRSAAAADIVVTGARAARPAAPRAALSLTGEAAEPSAANPGAVSPPARGDWNACTVDDPKRSLDPCGAQLDASARGSAGRAAAYVSDGLTRAWSGDLTAAIMAFDRAVAAAPRSHLAYLNRGLAYRRGGDLNRALADLDRAVALAPRSARAHYNRSLVYRQIGAIARAQADAKRAAALDPRYADLPN